MTQFKLTKGGIRVPVVSPPVGIEQLKQERMYADSGHQVVNPEVMKRVLNEHFGELNPEPEFEMLTLTEFARVYRELTGATRWTNDELYKFRVYEAAIHAKLKKDLTS